ncbi:hypothetical protein BV898_01704 [Hypsibius exemplaris]|uniref:Peptidase S1 domain-containing protein n=1 Tax=Hypsibius exemplaris TaxID=2072580 RepID=A0A1W0XAV7_HYPEX|nr:hypothetical protein BV898_01704 [Hypsibius exemplaris]
MSAVGPAGTRHTIGPPDSPQIFFRQAPTQNDCAVESANCDNLFPSESCCDEPMDPAIQSAVMDRYRRNSLSSNGTRRSILSVHDERHSAFTPVHNLAIMHYQKRSIFSSPRMTSDSSISSGTEHSFGNHRRGNHCWLPCCSDYPWKGHEKICLGLALLAILLIIVGGIVGTYFSFRAPGNFPTGSEIHQSPRIGIRVSATDGLDGSTGNDLVPPAGGADHPPRPKDRFGLHDFDASLLGELDCNELYTFRCGHNQCLPIPDWCIPETLVCNGVPDCEDLSDEYFCRCNAEQIRCTDGICKNRTEICRGADSCITDTPEPLHCNCLDDLPPHKFCDGFPDCADNLDEIECSTTCDGNDQFSCWRSGYGCVHKTSICDGIRDCANGEDEEECLRLLSDGESMPDSVDYVGTSRPAGIVLVRRWGTEFSPICLTPDVDLQADSYVGTMFCNHFGFARLLYAEPLILPKTAPSSNNKFYAFSPPTTSPTAATTGSDPSRHFIPVKQCESGSVLRVHCTEMMCSPRQDHRNKGVVVTENGELVLKRQEQFFPFVVQIYKRVWSSWVLRCGGVIVHPLWLITSSGCIDKNGYFKALAGPYWQSTNPKLMQSRDISMIVLAPETPATNGRSEIVLARLDKRLECHDFLRPVCLPDPGYQLSSAIGNGTNQFSHCVTLGWNVTSNRASSIPYPSELHLAREIQVVPTEDCSRSLWNRTPEPLDNLICVKISNRDNTNLLSDPGGILACASGTDSSKWELMGVLSGYKTRVTGNFVRVFALYSRLDQHLSWILKEFTNSDTSSP